MIVEFKQAKESQKWTDAHTYEVTHALGQEFFDWVKRYRALRSLNENENPYNVDTEPAQLS